MATLNQYHKLYHLFYGNELKETITLPTLPSSKKNQTSADYSTRHLHGSLKVQS